MRESRNNREKVPYRAPTLGDVFDGSLAKAFRKANIPLKTPEHEAELKQPKRPLETPDERARRITPEISEPKQGPVRQIYDTSAGEIKPFSDIMARRANEGAEQMKRALAGQKRK